MPILFVNHCTNSTSDDLSAWVLLPHRTSRIPVDAMWIRHLEHGTPVTYMRQSVKDLCADMIAFISACIMNEYFSGRKLGNSVSGDPDGNPL